MVRKATEKDIDSILRLLRQVNSVHAKGRPDLFVDGCTKYTPEELAQVIADETTPVFVWTDENDEAQGHAFIRLEVIQGQSNQVDRKMVYIDDICVDENCRRRHIATDLYEHVKTYAISQGCYHMTLNVWECNPEAMSFYRKMGMVPLKTNLECIL